MEGASDSTSATCTRTTEPRGSRSQFNLSHPVALHRARSSVVGATQCDTTAERAQVRMPRVGAEVAPRQQPPIIPLDPKSTAVIAERRPNQTSTTSITHDRSIARVEHRDIRRSRALDHRPPKQARTSKQPPISQLPEPSVPALPAHRRNRTKPWPHIPLNRSRAPTVWCPTQIA